MTRRRLPSTRYRKAPDSSMPSALSNPVSRPEHRLPALVLVGVAASLALLGLVILSSIGRGVGEPTVYAIKQAIWFIPAIIGGLILYRLDVERARPLIYPAAIATLVLLLLVLVPGVGSKINGARRWFDFGPASFQPSEVAKLGFAFLLAHYLGSQQRKLHTFMRGVMVPVLITGVFFGLLILQPDYGTAALYGAVGGVLIFLAGVRLIYLAPLIPMALGGFAYLVFIDPVRLQRVLSFLDLEGHREGSSYQLWQGMLAFGVGGWEGVGLGNGRQQMAFLPEAQTDFIFPIIGEELGLWATAGVVVAFLFLFAYTVSHFRRAPNLYQYLLAWAALLFLSGQALINFGVTTGLLPTKGMSLPFISYGGSNFITMALCVALLANLLTRWQSPELRFGPAGERYP